MHSTVDKLVLSMNQNIQQKQQAQPFSQMKPMQQTGIGATGGFGNTTGGFGGMQNKGFGAPQGQVQQPFQQKPLSALDLQIQALPHQIEHIGSTTSLQLSNVEQTKSQIIRHNNNNTIQSEFLANSKIDLKMTQKQEHKLDADLQSLQDAIKLCEKRCGAVFE
ncbi:Hypothetical_protein [Hexamita inflata]|uniref:Hypothetical_protein n=1 Tax=Hexamita inflata TaxID=28002 RepID=A0AA86NHQ8_9EUKA|nr:Hypothetical protein HINF_LOCUS7183 [Hexamita inflata]